jgi:hypothetical protein
MVNEKPTWFWAVTATVILVWAAAGTMAIFFIITGDVYNGEAVIIAATIFLVVIYYLSEWVATRR